MNDISVYGTSVGGDRSLLSYQQQWIAPIIRIFECIKVAIMKIHQTVSNISPYKPSIGNSDMVHETNQYRCSYGMCYYHVAICIGVRK